MVEVVLLIAVLSAVVAVDNAYPATPAPVVAAEPVPKTTEPITVCVTLFPSTNVSSVKTWLLLPTE